MKIEIENIIEDLAQKMEQVIFFVGAGISVESGSPTGDDVIGISAQELYKKFSNNTNGQEIKELITLKARPETLFNYFEILRKRSELVQKQELPSVENLLHDVLQNMQPSKIHFSLAQLLKKEKCKMIFSLNYDSLIEKAFYALKNNYKQKTIDLVHKKEDFKKLNEKIIKGIEPSIPTIVKLHGHLSEQETQSYQNEESSLQYALLHLIPMDPEKADCLRIVMKNYILVFLGCSGNDDFDITPILLGQKAKKIIWINHWRDTLVITPTLDSKSYVTNPFKIIQQQNVNSSTKENIYITIDTCEFVNRVLRNLNLSNSDFNGGGAVLANGARRWEVGFKKWLTQQPDPLPLLVIGNLLRDFGLPEKAFNLLQDLNIEQNDNLDKSLQIEAELLKVQLLHHLGEFEDARVHIDNLIKMLPKLYPNNKGIRIRFHCQALKRRAFMVRDQALLSKDSNIRTELRKDAQQTFENWEKLLKENKSRFDTKEWEDLMYELNRDWAWLDRDTGKLQKALDRIDSQQSQDPYNQIKARVDGGWFALDEAKRRYLKHLDKVDNYVTKAMEYFTQAINLSEENSYLDIKANGLRSRAHVFLFQQMLEPNNFDYFRSSRIDLDDALGIYQSLGQEIERGMTLYDLALCTLAQRKLEDAMTLAKQANEILSISGDNISKYKLSSLLEDLKNRLPYERQFINNLDHILAES
jgi:NAD-dependent SIR2 family protein deacetylase